MTIEQMREEIAKECKKRTLPNGKCGCCELENIRNSDKSCWAAASDEQIKENYKLMFPEAEPTTETEPTIKDSGNRTEFSTGAVRDCKKGVGRMDLLPWAAIMEVSKHCENGAIKYGEHNVDKGIPTHSFCDSAARHLAKYLDGWTDEPHLLAAAWNLLWAIQMLLKKPDMVDTPWKEAEE